MLKLSKLVIPTLTALTLSTAVLAGNQGINSPSNAASSIVEPHPLAPAIIIKYKDSYSSKSVNESVKRSKDLGKAYGYNLNFKRMMSGDAEVVSVDIDLNKSGKKDLNALVAELSKREDIEYAEIDAWIIPYATPNDTAYNTQWHYFESAGGMRLPAAWDITTGSNSVVVAVLDTGYRPHADLAANVVGQYDMISSTSNGDGNGRDTNAQDPGDWTAAGECGTGSAASNSSWHGTHVAGTVGAVGNNNNDVTGVAWNIDLVPVRVLGKCGGSLSDIADGIRWASGLTVSGTPSNPNPADVINMSLGSGSPASCTSTYQNAINAAVGAGTTIVVAAGNSNSSSGYPPANCNNVVAVAATNRKGGRAYYSNFGSVIDVAAPGGDGCQPNSNSAPTSLSDCDGGIWNEANMIQSTYNTGTSNPGSDTIGALQGTSMASPHVAGLAALMYAVKPTTNPAEVESVLKSTARSFPNVSYHQCTTSNCGAGIVDAAAAVAAMDGGVVEPPTGNVLTNGVAVTGISGSTGSEVNYTMVVPSGASNLTFNMSGGSGDADLYVKYGSAPTTSSYDCRPYVGGNTESCPIASAQAGTYYVMVRAYSTFSGVSLTGSYSASVPNVAPNASFTYSCNNLSCSFNGSGSSDSDGTIANYAWSFGGSGSSINHTFSTAGTYSVTLTVTDDDGATDTQTRSVSVSAPANSPPIASFTSSCSDLTCSFNASASSDSDGMITSYSWSFGGSGVTATNTFASAGTYNVTLTVTDNDGTTDSQTNSVTVTAPPSGGNVLSNGVTVSGLSASTGNDLLYTMQVPAGATDISFVMSGGTGDADLYVKFGSAPTDSSYDCRPYAGGNNESCTGTQTGGTYYVRLKAYSSFSGVSIVGNYTAAGSGPTPIDTTTTNISVGSGAWKRYTVGLTSGYSNLTVTISGGSGDADLYVRRGSQSTTSAYDCRPYKNGNNETCTFNSPASGTWHIDLRGYSAASGVTLRVQAN
jgi:serine protease